MGVGHELLRLELSDDAAHYSELVAAVGHQRLPCRLVLYQLHCGEQTDVAHVADALVLCLEFLKYLAQHLAALIYVAQDIVVLVVVQAGNAGCACEGVSAVGQTALQYVIVEIVRDLPADRNAAELNVAAGNALREAYDIGLYAEILKREHLAGAPESRHYLVADHHDSELVADPAYARKVALRRDNDAVGAGDGLHNDGSNRVGAFIDDLLAELVNVVLAVLLLACEREVVAVHVRVEELHEAGDTRLQRIPSRLAGEVARAECGAMVASVAGEHLFSSGVHSRHLDGVLVCVGAAVGEEHLRDVVRHEVNDHLGELRAALAGVARADEAELLRLLLDGVDDGAAAEAHVQVDELAGHIGVSAAVVVPEVDTLALFHGDGVQPLLL